MRDSALVLDGFFVVGLLLLLVLHFAEKKSVKLAAVAVKV
jgi:hypothetical protein